MLCNRTCLNGAVVLGLIATLTPSLWGDGGLTWFTDQAEFEAFNQAQGLFLSGIEDYEESILPPNDGEAFDDPLESFVPNLPNGYPFPVGMTGLPNLIVQSNILGGNPTVPNARGVDGLATLSVGFLEATSDVVVATILEDSLDLIFTDDRRGVGLNPITFPFMPGDHSVEVRVFSPTNVFMGMMVTPADPSGANFIGVQAQDPIGRINIFDPDFGAAGGDNIQAWQPDPPRGPIWFTDQAEFEAFMAGEGKFRKGIEDFEESILPPDLSFPIDDPLQSGEPNLPGGFPFPVGMTGLPNLIVQSNGLGGNPTVPDPIGENGLGAVSVGFLDVASDVVLANAGGSLDLIFTDEKSGVGFNPIAILFLPEEDSVAVRVYSATNEFLGLMLTPGDPSGANFIGVWSLEPIGRINIFGLGSVGPGGDNIQAWQVDPLIGACCMPGNACEVLTEIDCLAAGGEYRGDGTTCASGPPLTFEAFPELPIPDGDPRGVSHTINVPDDFSITDVNIDLTITHTWVGDLCVQVSHNGVTVQLIQRPGEAVKGDPCHLGSPFGCSADNYAGIVLDDEGKGGTIETLCLTDLSSPPNYIPNELLSAFDGLSAAGDWTITVSDTARAFTGVFNSWSLEFATPGGCPAHVDFFLDSVEFEIALSKAGKDLKGFEDFSENVLPDESFLFMDDPLDTNTSNEAFPEGILIDNLTFQSNVGGSDSSQPNPTGVDGLAVATIGLQGATGDLVVSNITPNALDILSGPPAGDNHTALGLTLVTFQAAGDHTVRVDVYDKENNLLGRIAGVPAPIVGGGFLGIVASEGTTIGRVNIFDPFGAEGVYDVAAYFSNPCPADFDNTGDVGVNDLLFLLGAWGDCPKKGDCPADFDNTGDVGVNDLLFLLGNWGPCL